MVVCYHTGRYIVHAIQYLEPRAKYNNYLLAPDGNLLLATSEQVMNIYMRRNKF